MLRFFFTPPAKAFCSARQRTRAIAPHQTPLPSPHHITQSTVLPPQFASHHVILVAFLQHTHTSHEEAWLKTQCHPGFPALKLPTHLAPLLLWQ